MACIYKIINHLNNKVYIGKTIRPLQIRWREHQQDCFNREKDNKLYRAMRKYGIENFSIEVIEDNIEEEIIGEKEREYIQKYNSYYNGYNSTFGGEGESSVDFSIIEKLFLEGFNCLQISEKTGYTSKTISHALKAHNYKIIQHQGGKDKGKIVIYNGKEYPSYSTLARELIQNEETFKNKKITTVVTGISNSIKNKTSYFGYKFY